MTDDSLLDQLVINGPVLNPQALTSSQDPLFLILLFMKHILRKGNRINYWHQKTQVRKLEQKENLKSPSLSSKPPGGKSLQ